MTDEEIAREAVVNMIKVTPYLPQDGDWWVSIGGATGETLQNHTLYANKDNAEFDRDIYRKAALPHVIEAIRQARKQYPVTSPVSDHVVQAAKDYLAARMLENMPGLNSMYVKALLRHIDHLERLVGWLTVERDCDMYAGLDALKKESI